MLTLPNYDTWKLASPADDGEPRCGDIVRCRVPLYGPFADDCDDTHADLVGELCAGYGLTIDGFAHIGETVILVDHPVRWFDIELMRRVE